MINTLIPIEYQNQRILTTEQLAQVYETDVKNIHDNFKNNKDHFISGKHYYFLEGDELKEFKNRIPDLIGEPLKYTSRLYLWTERGASRHCKILDTDKAWQQFDNLENTYFYVKNNQVKLDAGNEKLKIQAMNAKARLENAKVKKADLMLKMINTVETLSEEYKNILVNGVTEILTGQKLLPMKESVQKTYSATEIGEMFGISANKVGRLSNQYDLKTKEYGDYYHDKSQYSTKEVDTFRYFDSVIPRFEEILGRGANQLVVL